MKNASLPTIDGKPSNVFTVNKSCESLTTGSSSCLLTFGPIATTNVLAPISRRTLPESGWVPSSYHKKGMRWHINLTKQAKNRRKIEPTVLCETVKIYIGSTCHLLANANSLKKKFRELSAYVCTFNLTFNHTKRFVGFLPRSVSLQ